MKKLFLLLPLLLATAAFCAVSPFRLFLNGNPGEIHPLVEHNEIYLPLQEVASLFHLKATVDLANRSILLEPENGAQASPAKIDATGAVIAGDVSLGAPVANLGVDLFRANQSFSAEQNKAAIEAWIRSGDAAYAGEHGRVTEVTTDASGNFAFFHVPPGSYEIVAVHPLSPTETGYWWVPVRPVVKETLRVSLNHGNIIVIDLAENRRP